jgi:hypothetical protein
VSSNFAGFMIELENEPEKSVTDKFIRLDSYRNFGGVGRDGCVTGDHLDVGGVKKVAAVVLHDVDEAVLILRQKGFH